MLTRRTMIQGAAALGAAGKLTHEICDGEPNAHVAVYMKLQEFRRGVQIQTVRDMAEFATGAQTYSDLSAYAVSLLPGDEQ